MSKAGASPLARPIVLSCALAQALFGIVTLASLREASQPFELVFLSLTLPTLMLSFCERSIPLAAGLAASALVLNLGLLLAVAA